MGGGVGVDGVVSEEGSLSSDGCERLPQHGGVHHSAYNASVDGQRDGNADERERVQEVVRPIDRVDDPRGMGSEGVEAGGGVRLLSDEEVGGMGGAYGVDDEHLSGLVRLSDEVEGDSP